MTTRHDIIKLRRGTAAEWAASNPQPGGEILKLGEPGYEKDTGKLKIGDGVTGWNSLPYISAGVIVVEDIDHLISDVIQAGDGIELNFDDSNDTLTISNSPINNPLNNRVLTSDGTTTGIDAEPALTFDGYRLRIDCACPSGSAGLTLVGDQRSTSINSNVYSEPISTETEDGILTIRATSRLIFLGTRGSAASPSGLQVGDTMFIIRGDGYNPNGTLNVIGNLENRTTRIRGFVSASGNPYVASSLEFLTSSGSGLYDHSMVFDHNGILTIDGSPVGGAGTTIDNYGDNRLLTSDGTSTGIDGESNLTFNGSLLTVNGDMIANTGTLDVLAFDTNIEPDLLTGQIAWNNTEGTVDVGLTDTATISIGEHNVFRVRNETGSPLYKGQAVYASNAHSNGIITPALYVADGSVREIRFMGLLLENVNHNNNGYAINFGHIFNIDTRGNVASNIAVGDETWVDGDILYVHPTVAGKLTKAEPKHSISVAIVLDAASNGKIFVRPTSYGHLNDMHDVAVSGATNGQFLQYNSSTDYWIPSSSGNFTSINADSAKFTQLYPTVVSNGTVSGNVSTNVANGQIFDMTVSGSTTLSNPTNPVDGVTIRWRVTQDGTGGHTVNLDTKFQIPSSASSPLPWSTSPNSTDILAATYHAGRDKWDVVAFVPGY